MSRVELSIAAVAVLVAAAAYALTIAFGWLSIGSEPGEGAAAEGVFVVGAVLALLVAAGSCFVAGIRGRRPSRVDPLIPPAAAAFVVARFYGYDPYYAPTLRRFSDDGSVAAVWVYGLVLGLVLSAGLIVVRSHVGFPVTAILLLVCVGTVFAMGAGH